MHWLIIILVWHRDNVLGNFVASLETGAVLLLAGRPLMRKLLKRAREHLADEVDEHVTTLHRRFDDIWDYLSAGDNDPPPPPPE